MKPHRPHPCSDFAGILPATKGDEAPLPWTPLPSSLFHVFIFARPDSVLTQKRAGRFQLNCVPKQRRRREDATQGLAADALRVFYFQDLRSAMPEPVPTPTGE
jgi:hypothetical protein